jgi:hypothetical protein
MSVFLPVQSIEPMTLVTSNDKCQFFTTFSLALDENSDTCENAQLLTFMWGINPKFVVTEGLAGLQSLKGTTTREGIFLKLTKTLNSL